VKVEAPAGIRDPGKKKPRRTPATEKPPRIRDPGVSKPRDAPKPTPEREVERRGN
jgi:hypothetical protein